MNPWKNVLKQNICTVEELNKNINLNNTEERILKRIAEKHPINITQHYLSLIDTENKNDPIRKIIIPSSDEVSMLGYYDTSGEIYNTKVTGLQHKYSQTALILTTNYCAAFCRFCFRRRLVGKSTKEILSNFDVVLDYIKKHKEINNVLLSGGDPLTLNTEIINEYLKELTKIDHLDYIRIGTRVPVVLPSRILSDPDLLSVLKEQSLKKRIHIVTHLLHPKEISKRFMKAINQLQQCGLIIHDQTVLLKGINDNPLILSELLNKLVSIGINPYYIFQCRPVKGCKHFQVPLREGYGIIENAKKYMSGLSKRFKYIMSHKTGKIEIIGLDEDYMYFKYHQAKNPQNIGRFFKRSINLSARWLDDLPAGDSIYTV